MTMLCMRLACRIFKVTNTHNM